MLILPPKPDIFPDELVRNGFTLTTPSDGWIQMVATAHTVVSGLSFPLDSLKTEL